MNKRRRAVCSPSSFSVLAKKIWATGIPYFFPVAGLAARVSSKEPPFTTQDLDTGFRVLKLDSSNMEDVYYTPEDFDEKSLFNDNIKPDRLENDGEDLLFQVMIELGIELSAKIENTSIAGKTVWNVSDGYLLACIAVR